MIETVIRAARSEGRQALFEHELLEILARLGLAVPRHQFLPLESLDSPVVDPGLADRRGVVKVVSERILHKSDVGGVAFVERVTPEEISRVARSICDGLDDELRPTVRGFLLAEAIEHERGLGRELIFGARHTEAFGVVYTLGFGGTGVEALSAAARPGQTTTLFKPGLTSDQQLRAKLGQALFARWICGGVRGVDGVVTPEQFSHEVRRWTAAFEQLRQAAAAAGTSLAELELNPIVWTADRRWMPLDALLRLGLAADEAAGPTAEFSLDRLRLGVSPRSVALVGVSTKINIGRIILRSILAGGFDPERIRVVRDAGPSAIDGVVCVPSVTALPEPVDLLIVAVAASATVDVLAEAIASNTARAVLLIPGGMGETDQGRAIERRIVELLASAPAERRPAVIGNNSLGIVSTRARFDSLFIPREKLPRRPEAPYTDLALISQSGAFMIAQLTRLTFLHPALQISLGNQIDARLSHFVELAATEPGVRTIALYVEGLKPGDGARLAAVVRDVVADGRDVVVYKAGRSRSGQAAAMGHTASVAGDYRVFVELLGDAGALVADSFADFADLVRLAVTVGRRRPAGRRVALLSNAGYEAVGMADSHEAAGLELAPLSATTRERIAAVLDQARIGHLVSAGNPLDLTPMAPDEVHALCMRALLDDPAVDVGVFGNVPLTSAVQSLPPGILEGDRYDAPGGYAARTIELFGAAAKPFVVVVDAGQLYDPLANHLQEAGLAVFRHADRAVRLLGRYLR